MASSTFPLSCVLLLPPLSHSPSHPYFQFSVVLALISRQVCRTRILFIIGLGLVRILGREVGNKNLYMVSRHFFLFLLKSNDNNGLEPIKILSKRHTIWSWTSDTRKEWTSRLTLHINSSNSSKRVSLREKKLS